MSILETEIDALSFSRLSFVVVAHGVRVQRRHWKTKIHCVWLHAVYVRVNELCEHWIWLMCSRLKCVYVNFNSTRQRRHTISRSIAPAIFMFVFATILLTSFFPYRLWYGGRHQQKQRWQWPYNISLICLEFSMKTISRIAKRNEKTRDDPTTSTSSDDVVHAARRRWELRNNKKNYGDVRTNKSISQVSMSTSSFFLFFFCSQKRMDWKYQCNVFVLKHLVVLGAKSKNKKNRKKKLERHYTKSVLYTYNNKYHDNIDEQQTSSSHKHNVAFSQMLYEKSDRCSSWTPNHIVFLVRHTCSANIVYNAKISMEKTAVDIWRVHLDWRTLCATIRIKHFPFKTKKSIFRSTRLIRNGIRKL